MRRSRSASLQPERQSHKSAATAARRSVGNGSGRSVAGPVSCWLKNRRAESFEQSGLESASEEVSCEMVEDIENCRDILAPPLRGEEVRVYQIRRHTRCGITLQSVQDPDSGFRNLWNPKQSLGERFLEVGAYTGTSRQADEGRLDQLLPRKVSEFQSGPIDSVDVSQSDSDKGCWAIDLNESSENDVQFVSKILPVGIIRFRQSDEVLTQADGSGPLPLALEPVYRGAGDAELLRQDSQDFGRKVSRRFQAWPQPVSRITFPNKFLEFCGRIL